MREYILTEKERRAIRQYLKDGKATNLIYVLRHRTKQSFERLREDLILLKKLIELETTLTETLNE